AVAVQADGGVVDLIETVLKTGQQVGAQTAIGLAQAGGNKFLFHQEVVAFAPEILHIYGWPLHKGPRLAQGVYASQTVAQAEQCIKVVQIGGVAALARIEGKIKTLITA